MLKKPRRKILQEVLAVIFATQFSQIVNIQIAPKFRLIRRIQTGTLKQKFVLLRHFTEFPRQPSVGFLIIRAFHPLERNRNNRVLSHESGTKITLLHHRQT